MGITTTLLASTTVTTAAVDAVAATITDLGVYSKAQIVLVVTDKQDAVGDTLDVFIDTSPDDGTSWYNVIHFPQLLGNGTDAQTVFATLDPSGAAGTATVDATSNAADSTVRPSIFSNCLRVRYTLVDGGAHGQSFTFAVKAYFS